jgi:hypothetical protein
MAEVWPLTPSPRPHVRCSSPMPESSALPTISTLVNTHERQRNLRCCDTDCYTTSLARRSRKHPKRSAPYTGSSLASPLNSRRKARLGSAGGSNAVTLKPNTLLRHNVLFSYSNAGKRRPHWRGRAILGRFSESKRRHAKTTHGHQLRAYRGQSLRPQADITTNGFYRPSAARRLSRRTTVPMAPFGKYEARCLPRRRSSQLNGIRAAFCALCREHNTWPFPTVVLPPLE